MEENSRNQGNSDRQFDRPKENKPNKRNARQNTSGNDMETETSEAMERGNERRGWYSTSVPDNYERDSE